MCIIIVNKGDRLTEDILSNSFDSNEDGAGIAWADGHIHSFKTMKKDEFIAKYNEIYEAGIRNIMTHCRIKTHGSVSESNTHPFPVHDDKMLMHNGIIRNKYY